VTFRSSSPVRPVVLFLGMLRIPIGIAYPFQIVYKKVPLILMVAFLPSSPSVPSYFFKTIYDSALRLLSELHILSELYIVNTPNTSGDSVRPVRPFRPTFVKHIGFRLISTIGIRDYYRDYA